MGKKKDTAVDKKEAAIELAEINRQLEEIDKVTEFIDAPMKLWSGKWCCDGTGVYKLLPSKNDPDLLVRVEASHQQIMPTGIVENIETGEQRYIISFSVKRNNQFVWKTVKVEPAICCSKSKIVSLSNLGVAVNDNTAKYLVAYIADMFRLNQDGLPVSRSISRLGWVKNEFFPYSPDIVFDGDNEQGKVVQSIKREGSFEVWKAECLSYRKNLTVRLIMASSFASVLINKIGGLCFSAHFWGASGVGKTVGLIVAASIWGEPDQLYVSVDATLNFFTNRSAFMGSLPMLIDEAQLDKNIIDKLIYALAEGKTRGKLDRSSREKENKTWENVSVFTGEAPIVKASSGAGAINRVLEIEISGALFKDFTQTLDIVRSNYGHAGTEYIKYLQRADTMELKREYRDICKELEASDSTGKQIQNLAFLILADRIAGRCIFTDEEELNVSQWTEVMKSKKEVSTAERAYHFIIDWIAANENYFSETSPKIYGTVTKDYCLFNRGELLRVLSDNNFDFDAVKKEWADLRYLEKTCQGKYAFLTTVGSKETKAYYAKVLFREETILNDFEDVIDYQEKLTFV